MRTVMITGAAHGLGLACANRLRHDGYTVVTVDRDRPADHLTDVSDPIAVTALREDVGIVDILINSAAVVGPTGVLWEISDLDWKHTFDVNVTGVFNMCRAFIPGMIEHGWGRVVNLASTAGKDGSPKMSAYAATKASVIGLTKSLGAETATTGVLVNAVAPAAFETPMLDKTDPSVLERLKGLIPMGRVGQPAELAALVAWLVSEECSFSTGAVYDISGGRACY